MDEYDQKPKSGGSLTPRSLLAVGLALMGLSRLCDGAAVLFAFAGPLASSGVGIILLVIASRIYRGENWLF
jgi:hypothetical protein